MKKYVVIYMLLLSINSVHAGFNGRTQHSRANCVNNESITWDATRYRVLVTVIRHLRDGSLVCAFSTGWENTWRSAAVHWGEALPGSGWQVMGYHWEKDENGRETLIDQTDVSDCSIYDGWWDKK